MQAEKTNSSQTLAEIFAELKKEGREEGIKEVLEQVIKELATESYSDEHIATITKLEVDEVRDLRRSFKN